MQHRSVPWHQRKVPPRTLRILGRVYGVIAMAVMAAPLWWIDDVALEHVLGLTAINLAVGCLLLTTAQAHFTSASDAETTAELQAKLDLVMPREVV